jgi:hypothetical protein
MVNLYLYKKSDMGAEVLVRCALESIHHKDVSALHGCINRFLRSTLR